MSKEYTTINIRLPKDVSKKLRIYLIENDLSVSEWFIKLLDGHFGQASPIAGHSDHTPAVQPAPAEKDAETVESA